MIIADNDDRPTDAVRQDMHIEDGGADLQGEVDDLVPFALLIINKYHQGEGGGEGEGRRAYIGYTQAVQKFIICVRVIAPTLKSVFFLRLSCCST